MLERIPFYSAPQPEVTADRQQNALHPIRELNHEATARSGQHVPGVGDDSRAVWHRQKRYQRVRSPLSAHSPSSSPRRCPPTEQGRPENSRDYPRAHAREPPKTTRKFKSHASCGVTAETTQNELSRRPDDSPEKAAVSGDGNEVDQKLRGLAPHLVNKQVISHQSSANKVLNY